MSKLIDLRRTFQEGRKLPINSLDQGILQSWQRCAGMGLSMNAHADYQRLEGRSLERLLNHNSALLHAARPHMDRLYDAIAGAGWSALLTDCQNVAIHTLHSQRMDDHRIASAFRTGALLGEAEIGTSAMSCALADKRFTRVYGFEHYNEFHRQFHCAATPILDPQGHVCGALDITSASPDASEGIFLLLQQCARNIQTEMIRQLDQARILMLGFEPISGLTPDAMVIALDEQGDLIAANLLASQVLGICLQSRQSIPFEQVFDTPLSRLGHSTQQPCLLRLHNGVSLYAMKGQRAAASVSSGHTNDFSGSSENPISFGDSAILVGMNKALRVIDRLPVLVLGESGTGKEIMATALHQSSPAASGPLISLNCAAIPENLIESELFGYLPGAFTGASKQGAAGHLRDADGGTLFLDEIGDMPMALQTRLLRVLETREVAPLGGSQSYKVNFQLICATHKGLPELIERGEFRQDLYYRINGFRLTLPALRQRQNLLTLAQGILAELAGTRTPRYLSEELAAAIQAFDWPGNVRQLKHALIYADAMAEADEPLTLADLPDELQDVLCEFQSSSTPLNRNDTASPNQLDQHNLRLIEDTLQRFDGNVSKAAAHLGIARSTIYRKRSRPV
ncbi:MAG: hypothetical protein CMI09_13990 [Oceanospirillaceae bacterium]|nr:hypothetical protein [Oceanospirillaceae bacterium]